MRYESISYRVVQSLSPLSPALSSCSHAKVIRTHERIQVETLIAMGYGARSSDAASIKKCNLLAISGQGAPSSLLLKGEQREEGSVVEVAGEPASQACRSSGKTRGSLLRDPPPPPPPHRSLALLYSCSELYPGLFLVPLSLPLTRRIRGHVSLFTPQLSSLARNLPRLRVIIS